MGIYKNNISLPCNWSRGVWAWSIFFLIAIAGAAIYIETTGWPAMLWLKYLLRIVFIASLIGTVGYMPIRLKANDAKISARRLFGSLEVPLNEVIEIKQIPKSYVHTSIRIFGSGGPFGFLGLFKNQILGKYTMYATDLKKLILIRTEKRIYVFSCSRPQDFLEFVEKRVCR